MQGPTVLSAKSLMTRHSSAFLEAVSRSVLSACARCGADKTALPAGVLVTSPPNPESGDLSFDFYVLAKAFKGVDAGTVAELVVKELDTGLVDSAVVAGRYINLYVAQAPWAQAAIKDVLGWSFASCDVDIPAVPEKPEHWLMEFSSPNTNKPQHLGHVRNNLLGDSCSRLLSMLGHKVTKVSLVNDRGIHICKSMLAYKKYGLGEVPDTEGGATKGDHLVGKYYVQFEKVFQDEWKGWLASEEAHEHFQKWQTSQKCAECIKKIKKAQDKADHEKNPETKEELLKKVPNLFDCFATCFKDYYFANISPIGLECSSMLEEWEAAAESDAPESDELYNLWKRLNAWVLSGFWATYKRMGIDFDHVDYESLTYQLGKSICEDGVKNGLMHKTEAGAVAIKYDKMPSLKKPSGEKVLLRANGTSVYMTQDLGTAFMRWDKFSAERMVYVVAEEQREHFQTLFGLLALLRPEMKDRFLHLSYGMVNLTSGRMKSREGTVVDADNLMDEVRDLAAASTRTKCPDLAEVEVMERAEKIGLAALKFFILSCSPESTILYDPKASIKFEGKTGPYVLYAYVRTRSILRKCETSADAVLAAGASSMACLSCLGTPEERAIVHCLFSFNSAMAAAAKSLDPAKVCNAVFALAQAFNKFFFEKEKHPIVECADAATKQARLLLTETVGVAIKSGLGLLGIETLEHM